MPCLAACYYSNVDIPVGWMSNWAQPPHHCIPPINLGSKHFRKTFADKTEGFLVQSWWIFAVIHLVLGVVWKVSFEQISCWTSFTVFVCWILSRFVGKQCFITLRLCGSSRRGEDRWMYLLKLVWLHHSQFRQRHLGSFTQGNLTLFQRTHRFEY